MEPTGMGSREVNNKSPEVVLILFVSASSSR